MPVLGTRIWPISPVALDAGDTGVTASANRHRSSRDSTGRSARRPEVRRETRPEAWAEVWRDACRDFTRCSGFDIGVIPARRSGANALPTLAESRCAAAQPKAAALLRVMEVPH